MAAFSYNFVNYRSELEAASDFFTANGWTSFLKSLKDSNNLIAVVNKKLVVSGQATRTPEILQKGVINGRYSWRIKIPMYITYQSSEQYSTQSVDVILLVTRVSTLNNPKGIGVEQFVTSISDDSIGGT
jgi:intracellular multiplication protein IcmL